VVTGHAGAVGADGGPDWEALARVGGTLVVLMGVTTRAAIAAALVRGGRAPDTPVAVIQDGTTPAQRVVRTTLSHLADVELGPPAVIVVGPVAALGTAAAPGTTAAPRDAPGPDTPFLRKLFSKKDDPPGRVCPELVIISAQDSPRYRRIGH